MKVLVDRCSSCGRKYDGEYALCYECMNEVSKYSYGEKCKKCGRMLKIPNDEICEYCRKVKPSFDRATAIFPYKDNFKNAVKGLKFKNEFYRFKGMARLIYDSTVSMNEKADCIVYVPSDIRAYFKRNYCLTQELANYLSKKLKIPVYHGFLIKKLKVKRQSKVKFEERYKNVKEGFTKNPLSLKSVEGKNVLLIDDVITTGSTVSECASFLKSLGAKSVFVTALSYGASK